MEVVAVAVAGAVWVLVTEADLEAAEEEADMLRLHSGIVYFVRIVPSFVGSFFCNSTRADAPSPLSISEELRKLTIAEPAMEQAPPASSRGHPEGSASFGLTISWSRWFDNEGIRFKDEV